MRWLLFALVLLTAGCVSAPHAVREPIDAAELRSRLQRLETFGLQGRLAAAVGADGFNSDLNWQQQGNRSTVQLRSPLGFGSATIVTDAQSVSFSSSRGDHLDGPDAVAELERRLGFRPPIASLRYWVLGVADPASQAVESASPAGNLASLDQDGWRVEYAEYRNAILAGRLASMPRRLTLMRDGIKLRLIVSEWLLEPR